MTKQFRARTKTACEIAGVDPNRFNEAVHAGHYPCAPETRAGSARVFDVEDLVCLTVYRRQLDRDVPPRRAGDVACGLRRVLRENPGANRVLQIMPEMGSPFYVLAEHFNPDATHQGGYSIAEVREFRLETIRAGVIAALEDEAGIIGEE